MDNKTIKYSIILPTYNEVQNLPIMVELIEKYLSNISYEIIVVDDNSSDGTGEMAEKLSTIFGSHKIKFLHRKCKLGLGTAYIDGFKLSTGDFVIIMDCDLSHHPKYILEFIEKQNATDCDIVTGTRYYNNFLDSSRMAGVCGWDIKRKIISSGANTLIHMLLNPNTSDLTGSFRIYKRNVFEKLLPKISSIGFGFQMEIMVLAKISNLKVEEVPIIFVDRYFGKSKISMNEILRFVQCLLTLTIKKYASSNNNELNNL